MEETKLKFADILNLDEQKRKEIILNGNRINSSDVMNDFERGLIIKTLSEASRIELIKSSILDEIQNFNIIMTLSEESRYEILNDSNVKLYNSNKQSIILSLSEELRNKIITDNNIELDDSDRENIILTLSDEHRESLLEITSSLDEKDFIKKSLNEQDEIKGLDEYFSIDDIYKFTEASRIKLIEKHIKNNNYKNVVHQYRLSYLVEKISEDSKLYLIEKYNLNESGAFDAIIRNLSEQSKIRLLEKRDNIVENTKILKSFTEETRKKLLKEGKIKCSQRSILLICSGETRKEFLDSNTVDLEPQERIEIILSLDDSQREKYISNLSEEEKNVLESINSVIEAKNHPDETISNTYAERLGLPEDMTIGVELEAEGKNANLVKAFGCVLPNWEADNDGSLEEGVEVISPILHDSINDMKELECVCNAMQQAQLETTERCGGHIHIGAGYFESNPYAFGNLLTIWNECEELFYKMGNEKGTVPREGILEYAKASHGDLENLSKGKKFNVREMSEFEKIQEDLTDVEDKYRGLNLGHYGEEGKDTIEFRIPNGTINPKTVKENIKLFGSLMQISKEMALNPEYKKEEFETLMDRGLAEGEKVEALLNLLFDDEQTKSIYRERWDSVKDEKIFDELTAGQTPTFERGNYRIANKQDIKEVVNSQEAIAEMSGVTEEVKREAKEREQQSKLNDESIDNNDESR